MLYHYRCWYYWLNPVVDSPFPSFPVCQPVITFADKTAYIAFVQTLNVFLNDQKHISVIK